MTTPPPTPRVYHITHVNNLPAIITAGVLRSDAAILAQGGPSTPIGMSTIKQRRLTLPVSCHPGLHVGDCVPFYFCPRSIMLNVIYYRNHPELTYRGGQGPIVHLVADLHAVVSWASSQGREWAFSLSNAGAYYTQFRASLSQLGDIDWDAVASTNFRPASWTPSGNQVREWKQAEFLLKDSFPWSLVQQIGVHSQAVAGQVHATLAGASHQPTVTVEPTWYF